MFERTGGEWPQQAKLVPNDGDSKDQFGRSVALAADGSTALVGAWHDEDPNGENDGSAYVFERTDGDWSQQAKLVLNDGDSGGYFGVSVALADDSSTALVGDFWDREPNLQGAAYVFERTGGEWPQQAKLVPNDGDEADQFGFSVALAADGSTALIGAWNDENPNGSHAGSAYVFERFRGKWAQQTKLVPDDGDKDDQFGASVALADDGSTALIGAYQDEDPNGEEAGAAYVFTL